MENIFLDADLKIAQESDIVDLVSAQDGAYSEGEFDNLMKDHRSRSDNRDNMSAYLVIVNGIHFETEDPDRFGPDPATLGVMLDLKQRRGTAVFYGSDMVRSDGYAFFRTTIHELGRQFNLQQVTNQTIGYWMANTNTKEIGRGMKTLVFLCRNILFYYMLLIILTHKITATFLYIYSYISSSHLRSYEKS